MFYSLSVCCSQVSITCFCTFIPLYMSDTLLYWRRRIGCSSVMISVWKRTYFVDVSVHRNSGISWESQVICRPITINFLWPYTLIYSIIRRNLLSCVADVLRYVNCTEKKRNAISRFRPMWMNSALLSDFMRSWTAWPLKMEPIGRLETWVWNYLPTPRKIPKERRSK
jgi:hypothetical protein